MCWMIRSRDIRGEEKFIRLNEITNSDDVTVVMVTLLSGVPLLGRMITMVMSSPRYGISSSCTLSSGKCLYLNLVSWYIMLTEQVRLSLTEKSDTYTLSLSNLFFH